MKTCKLTCKKLKEVKSSYICKNHHLTNVVQPDPVGSIHFLLDVPGYDEVLAAVQRVLQSGRRQRRPALWGHQVRVAVGPRKPDRAADDWDGIDGSTASFRQGAQVLRAEGVPEVRAAPSWSWEVFPAPNCEVGRVVWARPGREDGCGEGRTHVGRSVRRQLTADEEEPLKDCDGRRSDDASYGFIPAESTLILMFERRELVRLRNNVSRLQLQSRLVPASHQSSRRWRSNNSHDICDARFMRSNGKET